MPLTNEQEQILALVSTIKHVLQNGPATEANKQDVVTLTHTLCDLMGEPHSTVTDERSFWALLGRATDRLQPN